MTDTENWCAALQKDLSSMKKWADISLMKYSYREMPNPAHGGEQAYAGI